MAQVALPHAYPDPVTRALITISAMTASIMVTIDMSIANVALPHMQASMSASEDQIVWVLTSYIVAGAIATPLAGWLASRYGRKRVMVFSAIGFVSASALCGSAQTLEFMVFARLLQGICGASIIPLGQATLLDIYPPERHGEAMAMYSLGSMVGPLIGPTFGGWLTDAMSWRWVFFINVPVGMIAILGMAAFMKKQTDVYSGRFDLFGFGMLAIALGAFQLMLDRGEQKDWFDSVEIWTYAIILGLAVWASFVHLMTAKNTFIRIELFNDRNFAIGSVIGIAIGFVAFATMPMIIIYMQNLLGYTALLTGILSLPRGTGSILGIFVVTRLIKRFDIRILLASGLAITAFSLALYARIDLYVDERTLIFIGLIQGFGGGLMFVPLSVIVFSTLPVNLRNEGAAMYALIRNVGQSMGISFLQRELIHYTAQTKSVLAENIRPDNPILDYAAQGFDPSSVESVATISAEVTRQAAMVGNVQVFWMVCFVGFAAVPLAFLMRRMRQPPENNVALPVD